MPKFVYVPKEIALKPKLKTSKNKLSPEEKFNRLVLKLSKSRHNPTHHYKVFEYKVDINKNNILLGKRIVELYALFNGIGQHIYSVFKTDNEVDDYRHLRLVALSFYTDTESSDKKFKNTYLFN